MTDDKGRELLAQSIAQATRTSLDWTLNPTRIAPKLRFDMDTPAPKTEVATSPAPSPTGTAVVSPKVVPWLAVALGSLQLINSQLQATEGHTVAAKVLAVTLPVLTVLAGLFSPGLRKSDGAQ